MNALFTRVQPTPMNKGSLLLLLWSLLSCAGKPLKEGDRLLEYQKRGYVWPPVDYVPNTTGWRALMEERFHQIEELSTSGARYTGYYLTINAAFLAPNFTEHGFGLARAPMELVEEMQKAIRDGIETAGEERIHGSINGPQAPLMVQKEDLANRALRELLPYAEEWSGMKLIPHKPFGFRVYRNESQLLMHNDEAQTDIISLILHIDSEKAEPWPIFVEDYSGRTHEIVLTPGDILFFESSKCFHGRPRRFNGEWYSSIFLYYYPENWQDVNHELELHYAIPPHWKRDPVGERKYRELAMVETSMKNPGCPDDWCAVVDSVKWSDPGEEGFYITPTFRKVPFHPKSKNTGTDEL